MKKHKIKAKRLHEAQQNAEQLNEKNTQLQKRWSKVVELVNLSGGRQSLNLLIDFVRANDDRGKRTIPKPMMNNRMKGKRSS